MSDTCPLCGGELYDDAPDEWDLFRDIHHAEGCVLVRLHTERAAYDTAVEAAIGGEGE